MPQAIVGIADPVNQLSPGYLMAPFGWAAKSLATMIRAEAALTPYLLTLSRQRMHLIAMALAHLPDEANPSLAHLLITGAPAAVLDATLGHRPPGLKRALKHLPVKVIGRDSYRHLIELLDDGSAVGIIHHVEALEEHIIASIYDMPPPLRRTIGLASSEFFTSFEGLTESLGFLVARGAASSLDALISELGSIRLPRHLIARLANLVRALPLPETMPPPQVGGAHRLDSIRAIHQLAKRWRNCLANYTVEVNDGRAAIYYWTGPISPAICLLLRHGRLGWALEDALGPENAELPLDRLQEIHDAFAAIGIPTAAAIRALTWAAESEDRRRLGLPRLQGRHEGEACDEMYEESDAASERRS